MTRARRDGNGKPVVLAAYQHVYETAPAEVADRATALTMATLFSHGATQLLAGEADRLLSDPYYVRNRVLEPSTAALLKRWYDFLVAHDELLMPPSLLDVTPSYAGDYNGELDVSFADAEVSVTAEAGQGLAAHRAGRRRLVVHLINFRGQADTLWDARRDAQRSPGRATLSFRGLRGRRPRVWSADPDGLGRLQPVPAREDGDRHVAVLPPLGVWQLVAVDL